MIIRVWMVIHDASLRFALGLAFTAALVLGSCYGYALLRSTGLA